VFANTRWERGLGAKSHKSECDGSIRGALCEAAVEGDGGRWWDEVDEVVVVVGFWVPKHKAGKGVGGQIPQI
jgi:hypothetical protein